MLILSQNFDLIILIFVVFLFIVGRFGIGLRYISVWDIIKNHINCFRDSKSERYVIMPIINYLVSPLLLGIAAALIETIDDGIINIITIIMSVLTAMLFTMLTLIIDMKSKIEGNPNYYSQEAEISKQSLIETYYAVMFEILVAIVVLLMCLFNAFTSSYNFMQSCIIYGLTFLFVVNLLIIIKRIFRVIDLDMKR